MAYGGDTSNDKFRASDQWERYIYMRDTGHAQYVEKADKCIKFFQGLQWDKADLDRLRAENRPALTINKIISTLSTIMGEQIFNRMEVAVRAPRTALRPEMGDVLNKLWNAYRCRRTSFRGCARTCSPTAASARAASTTCACRSTTTCAGTPSYYEAQRRRTCMVDPDAEDLRPGHLGRRAGD
jgi:hypothetical protein